MFIVLTWLETERLPPRSKNMLLHGQTFTQLVRFLSVFYDGQEADRLPFLYLEEEGLALYMHKHKG